MDNNSNYTHWRNLTDTSHLRAEMLVPGQDKVLTIKSVEKEKVVSNNGTVEEKPVAHFVEDILPMVLNVTNCETIEKMYGTGNIFDWVGKKIQIFATSTRVAGQSVPCLRIRKTIPTSDIPEYKCSVCGKTISEDIYRKSLEKYGKAYCSAECLNVDKNGKDVL